jgi:hypothetical protein
MPLINWNKELETRESITISNGIGGRLRADRTSKMRPENCANASPPDISPPGDPNVAQQMDLFWDEQEELGLFNAKTSMKKSANCTRDANDC